MNRPTESDWETMVFCQKIAHAVRKSDNLRLPSDPKVVADYMARTKKKNNHLIEWGYHSPWEQDS